MLLNYYFLIKIGREISEHNRVIPEHCRVIPEHCQVFPELSWVVLDCHPDAVGIRIILMPAIEDVTVFLDSSKGLMSKARTHHYIFIDALELLLVKLLHSARSINLCVYLKHFWDRVVVMDATVGFRRTKPHIDFDVVLLNSASF